MNYQEAVVYLDRHIELGWKPGLERIHRLLELMGTPQDRCPSIHVTGTNGKTTVTTIAAAVLDRMGLKSGTYTSPHLGSVEERFRVWGEIATTEQFAQAVADVAPFVDLLESETGERATYFELTTAVAFTHFANQSVDAAVVEVGMGGRLDATNVLAPGVAVLTGIALDHTRYLGSTPVEIAGEKLAILKPGGVLVTGYLSDPVAALADEFVDRAGALRHTIGRDFRIEDLRMSVGGWSFDLEGIYDRYEDLYVPLHGRHQAANSAVAIAAVEELFGRGLPADSVQAALASATVPARFEVVRRSPLTVLDGAHNPQAMQALARTIREELPSVGWNLVIGAFGDKDVQNMLCPLEGLVSGAIATAVDQERAMAPDDLVRFLGSALPGVPVTSMVPVARAVELAEEWCRPGDAILVTGSFCVAGEARTALIG